MNDDGVLEERDRTETQKDAQRFMAHPRATEGELTAFWLSVSFMCEEDDDGVSWEVLE